MTEVPENDIHKKSYSLSQKTYNKNKQEDIKKGQKKHLKLL